VIGHGVIGQAQLLADFLAGQMLADQAQNLSLARREPLDLAVSAAAVPVHHRLPTLPRPSEAWSTAGSAHGPQHPRL
jgi:hypothetical protein